MTRSALAAEALEQVLDVTRRLAAPFDLSTMLSTVADAARHLLHAERCSVWLHDPATDEMVLEISTDGPHVRIPIGHGLVGACARSRTPIHVPDCYADPRFDRTMDRRSGFRTRCSLSLPLIGHDGVLVGVMQLLNGADGVFDDEDQRLASVLAAQCAMALQRTRMTAALIEGEKLRGQMAVARLVQTSTLPQAMPTVIGYDCFGLSRPAEETGGDTFDLATIERGLLIVLADATGHGIAPALSVTQMHGMLRMAFRLGADLETIFKELNDLLVERMADDRFITAFVGELDPTTHVLRFISGGQGPILHWHAAEGRLARHPPNSFPLGALPLARPCAASTWRLEPGDALLLISDGLFEAHATSGEAFGEARVEAIVARYLAEDSADDSADHGAGSMLGLAAALLDAVDRFVEGEPPEDDRTLVLVRRDPLPLTSERSFERRLDALDAIFAFTTATLGEDDPSLRASIDFALEELFTNIIKYGHGKAPIVIRIDLIADGVAVTLDEPDAERFDVTQAPTVDIALPADEREAGGLGLHLIPKLVDDLTYTYDAVSRRSRIRFRKTRRAALPGDV